MFDNNPLTSLINPPVEKDVWRWGTVTSLSPLTVHMDGDSEPLLIEPDRLCPIQNGDRVRVHIVNRKACIIGVKTPAGMVIPENSIRVGSTWYPASGIQSCPSYSWTVQLNGWYGATIRMPLPYEPPYGYGFLYTVLKNNSFTIIANGGQTTTNSTEIRLLNFAHSTPNIELLQWQLVKQN